jgi:hypothetical protein
MASEKSADIAQRAKNIYEKQLRSQLEATNMHDYVAIEPDSEEHFLGKTLSDAIGAARAAHPDRLAFALRVGHSAAVHIGVMTP